MRTRQRGRRRRSDESVRRPRFSVGGRRRTEDGGRRTDSSGFGARELENWKNWFLQHFPLAASTRVLRQRIGIIGRIGFYSSRIATLSTTEIFAKVVRLKKVCDLQRPPAQSRRTLKPFKLTSAQEA